jgi:hypothetical protein
MVVIRWVADTLPSVVAGLFDQPAPCTITLTRATLAPGVETVAPGVETVAPGVETVAPGVETVAPGAGMVTGADMAKTRNAGTIIVFPSDSFRTGIQDGGTTITGTLITRITRMTILIIITRTTPPTLAETDRRPSKCWFKTRLLGAVTTVAQSMVSSDLERGARSANFSGIMACR